MPRGAIYTASKWAVDGFAETFSYDLAPLGIDSAIVEPGAMGTDLLGKMMQPKDESRLSHYGHLQQMGGEMM
ncbi:MAG: SDR family NAD(P)-dependent oxidoreductase, partial [Cyanobacteria bacterium P01_A01_bin.17]